MGGNERKQWLIKLGTGRIVGPFSTEKVLKLIHKGELTGEEQISLYPKTQWIAIASDPTFYDKLLEILTHSVNRGATFEDFDTTSAGVPLGSQDESGPEPGGENTQVSSQETGSDSKGARASAENFNQTEEFETEDWKFTQAAGTETQTTNDSKKENTSRKSENSKSKSRRRKKSKKKGKRGEYIDDDSVIELVDLKSEVKKQRGKRAVFPFLVLMFVAAFAYILVQDPEKGESRVRLIAPSKSTGQKLTDKQVKRKIGKGIGYYLLDDLRGYIKAQNEFVGILESGSKNTDAMSMLCLSYYEMWPYTHQDTDDLKAVARVTLMATRHDPTAVGTFTCRVVNLMIQGKYQEAKGLTETVLDGISNTEISPTTFYYFKAILLRDLGDYQTALGYLVSAEQLWPQWLRPYVLEAELFQEMNNPADASRRFRDVLKVKPNHKTAKIKNGLISFKYFRHYQEAKKVLKEALKLPTSAPGPVISDAYLGLAEIALYEKSTKNAMDYARKCFNANPTNKPCKNLIESLGGKIKLEDIRGQGTALVAEGDQFFREGDYNAAQALYKTAYELNKKNGLAAMKAGQCLWLLSLSSESIKWLNRAVKADPKLIAAYSLLADYYSQRFDFEAAAKVLAKAAKMSPKNYEVYRGYALIELRRSNPLGAIAFAQKALKLNSGDVESHILLAKSYLTNENYPEAFSSASRAVELEGTNRQAQIQYSKAIAGVQGTDVGINYMAQLVDRYPQVNEYRVALGEIYLVDERYMDAESVFKQIIQIQDKPKRALILLGEALAKQNRANEALDVYLRAAAIDPSDPEALFSAGLLYLQIKKAGDARAQFQRVLRVNTKYPLVHYYLGRAALMSGDSKTALEESMLERRLNPNLPESYILGAEAYTMMKQYSLCAGEYQKAIKVAPQGSDVYVKISKCYRLTGNLNIAEQMLIHAGKLDSGNPEIYKELGSILEKQGRKEDAAQAYKTYFQLFPQAPDRKLIEQRIMRF